MSEPQASSAPSCSQLLWIFTRIALTAAGSRAPSPSHRRQRFS